MHSFQVLFGHSCCKLGINCTFLQAPKTLLKKVEKKFLTLDLVYLPVCVVMVCCGDTLEL